MAKIPLAIPCRNEEMAVVKGRDVRAALSDAEIQVRNHGPRGRTAQHPRETGATIRNESPPGKGDGKADIRGIVDGDATCHASGLQRHCFGNGIRRALRRAI
jgi:hypothetical protein